MLYNYAYLVRFVIFVGLYFRHISLFTEKYQDIVIIEEKLTGMAANVILHLHKYILFQLWEITLIIQLTEMNLTRLRVLHNHLDK